VCNSRIQFASNESKLVPRNVEPGHTSKWTWISDGYLMQQYKNRGYFFFPLLPTFLSKKCVKVARHILVLLLLYKPCTFSLQFCAPWWMSWLGGQDIFWATFFCQHMAPSHPHKHQIYFWLDFRLVDVITLFALITFWKINCILV